MSFTCETKQSLPFVSVIIINYNGLRFLEGCLTSLLNLQYPRSQYEIILIDNCSSDTSVEFVKINFPSVIVFESKNNTGWVGGVNLGAKLAKGEYLVLLNNDIYVDTNWLYELVESVRNNNVEMSSSKNYVMDNPTIIAAAGCTINILGQGWDIGMGSKDNDCYSLPIEITHPGGAACIIKRRAIEKYGYVLDPDLFMFQDDLDMGWRARLLGYSVMYAPKAIVYHKRGGSSANSPISFYYFYRNMHLVFYQNLSQENLLKVMPLVDLDIFLTNFFKYLETRNPAFIMIIVGIFTYIRKNNKRLFRRRLCIQKLRKKSDKEVFALFSSQIILPKSIRHLRIERFFLPIINLYISLARIPVKKIDSIYYY